MKRSTPKTAAWAAAMMMAAVVGCGGDDDGDGDSPLADGGAADSAVPDGASPDAGGPPATLADTGLYQSGSSGPLADGVREFEVAWPLWSDGADKRRFVYLPGDATIDSSDMDYWVYPVGTKLWKEFSQDGTLLETRLLWKQAEGSWTAISYAWNQAGTEAVIADASGVDDVLGTNHDIPSQNHCRQCHGSQPDFVLGFSALQLDHAGGDFTLETLVSEDRLTTAPAETDDTGSPYYALPGDTLAHNALGYLHGNCGGCHHEEGDILGSIQFRARFSIGELATVETTAVYTTAVGVAQSRALPESYGATAIIEPGDHDASAVWERMGIRPGLPGMPPYGTEQPDDTARTAVAAWIDSLPN